MTAAETSTSEIRIKGRKTTLLVWILALVVFCAGVILVAIVWWSLIETQAQRTRYHDILHDFSLADALLNQQHLQLQVEVNKFLDEKDAAATLAPDTSLKLADEYQRIAAIPELRDSFTKIEAALQKLMRTRQDSFTWNKRFAEITGILPTAQQSVLEAVGRMKERIDVAEGKLRINQAIKFRTFNKGMEIDESEMAQSIIANFSLSKDLSAIRRNIVELALLCEQLRREEHRQQLLLLKNQNIYDALDRLHRILTSQEAADIPDIMAQLVTMLHTFETALFGSDFRIKPGSREIVAGENGEYHLLEERLLLRLKQKNLRRTAVEDFTAVHQALQQAKEKADSFAQALVAHGEQGLRQAWQTMLLVCTIAAAVFIFIALRIFRAIKQQIREIEETNIELEARTGKLQESEENLQRLSSDLLTVQDSERRRISLELHDELGQSLAALKIQVGAMARSSDASTPGALREKCDAVREKINQIIENVRRLSRDLSPVVLDDLGLQAAIENLIKDFSSTHGLKITHELTEIDHLFEPNVQRNIYRILQEALTNISKHAEADHVSVVITEDMSGVRFRVTDNGKGFELKKHFTEKKDAVRGMGLDAIKERVRIINGRISIKSQPGVGTTIDIYVPT